MRTDYVDLKTRKERRKERLSGVVKLIGCYLIVFLVCMLLLILGTSDIIWTDY